MAEYFPVFRHVGFVSFAGPAPGEELVEPNKHILVVLDDAAARDALKTLLKAGGYSVSCVANSRAALACLDREQRPFVILLDTNLPVLDGWHFRREQRQTPRLAAIPILASSGETVLPRAAVSQGPACFPRPVELQGLLEAVRSSSTPATAAAISSGLARLAA